MARLRPVSAALAVLLTAFGLSGCLSEAERADRAREKAQEALTRGDLAAVREALVELREVSQDSPESLLALTQLMSRAGEAPQAVWVLEEGLVRFPDADPLRLELGRIALIVGNPVLARSAVEPVKPESEQHLQALLILARAEIELGSLDRGLEILQQAEELYPDSPEAAAARIAALVRERRLEEAALAIEQVEKMLGPDDREMARQFELLAARIQATQGETEAALERLRALVESDLSDALALQNLVNLLVAENRADEARMLVEKAIEADPDQAQLRALLAQIELHGGDFEAAERAIRSAVDRSESPSSYMLLAQFYQQREQPERAADAFAEATERFPDAPMLVMHHAESLIDLDRLPEARARTESFRAKRPDDPHVEYLRARIELAEGNPAAAARRLRRNVSQLDRAYTQFWLGKALEETGDEAGAERRYGLALVRGGANPAPAIAMLALAERRGDWAAVGQRAIQLVQRSPGVPAGYETAITALVRTGENEAAEKLARRYHRAFEDRPEAAAMLALVLRGQGRLAEAAEVLDAAEKEHPGEPSLRAQRAMLLGTTGRFDEGIAVMRELAESEPENARHQATLAALLFGAGDEAGGTRAIDRAMELDPDDPSPLKLRAQYLASRSQFERARDDVQRYLWARPRDASVQFMHGAILAELDLTDAAISAYRRAIALDERSFAARNNLALILAEQDELDAGLEVAQKAYALAETNPHVIDTLGWLYLQKGLTDRSVALLEKAHELAPEIDSTQLHLALAYREAGRQDDARRVLTALVKRVDANSEVGAEANEALRSLGG